MVGGLYQPTAYASQFSDGIRKTWSFLFSPVNCAGNLVGDLVSAGTKFVVCVLNNANPGNLIP
jgi:hypothetical protein